MDKNKKHKKIRRDPHRLAIRIIALVLAISMVFSLAATLIFYFAYNV